MNLLLVTGNDVNEKFFVKGASGVLAAVKYSIRYRAYNMLRHVIAEGAKVDAPDFNGWTPLHHACQSGDLHIVKILVHSGANINTFSNSGLYPVHLAAKNNFPEVIHWLCQESEHPG